MPLIRADRRSRPRNAARRPAFLWEACEGRVLMASEGVVFHVAIQDAPAVARPDSGFATADFQVTLDPANIESPIVVTYSTADGSATAADGDYVPVTDGSVTFTPEQTTQTIHIQIPARTTVEVASQTFHVNLNSAFIDSPFSSGESVEIDEAQGVGTILNSHPAGQVQFASTTYEVDPAATFATIAIARANGRASGVGASFTTTTGGTAVAGVDYTPVTTQVSFGLDQSVATVNIPIDASALSTRDVTVNLALTDASGGADLGSPTTAVLIIHRVNPLIVTNTHDAGAGSLRSAINFADSSRAPANPTITFAINTEGSNPHTITPASPLPFITRPLTLDATTQPGYAGQPVIVLNGSALQESGDLTSDGLEVTAGDSTILGLAIRSFPGSAIVLVGPGSNRILSNRLGTDPTGRIAFPNLKDGVFLVNSAGNTIAANLISGNGNVGVDLFGASSSGNTIFGNTIGTDPAGSFAIPNAYDGVFLCGAPNNLVANNILSGNGNVGVQVYTAAASGNLIQGNVIGTNANGSYAVPNAYDGVFLNGAPSNYVTGNLISGNRSVGVQVFGASATRNAIVANKIGTDVSGTAAIPNGLDGVYLNNAPGNGVKDNLISGNGSSGLQIFGDGATNNAVSGNVIGLGSTNRPLGNAYGVFLNRTGSSGAGGPEAKNVIRGNRVAQVFRATTLAGSLMARNVAAKARSARTTRA